jgi:ubiquinone/menaquinone biosynthesis C-methylase UbiE
MTKLIVQTAAIVAAVAALGAGPSPQQQQHEHEQHSRLFPPEQLGTLEGPDRDAWQRPDQVMDKLLIADGSVVADLGAGAGYFTMRLASRVGPNGIVYAEDVQPQMIEAITRRTGRAQLRQVRTVLGTSTDPRLPAPVDAVLIVEAYHDISIEQPVVMLGNVARSLKPAGRVGIIEFKKDGWGPGPPMDQRIDPERIVRDAEAAGLRLLSHETFLRYQYMLVFTHR